MVYFIRARTHFQYAQSLLQELSSGQRALSLKILQDIYIQGLKALYALVELSPPQRSLTPEEILDRILPTLSGTEKEGLLRVKNLLFAEKDYNKEELVPLLSELKGCLNLIKTCLKPIL